MMTGNCFESIECRWFMTGVIPVEISTWFINGLGELSLPVDRRNDIYLRSPSAEIGVKFRQGRLELKYQTSPLGQYQINHHHGQVEKWTKWICNQPELSSWGKINSSTAWITVNKERYQRLYKLDIRDKINLIPVHQAEEGIIALEVTKLYLNQEPWWTIAIEYLGNNIDLENILLHTFQLLTIDYPGKPLQIQDSFGYPQWLIKIIG